MGYGNLDAELPILRLETFIVLFNTARVGSSTHKPPRALTSALTRISRSSDLRQCSNPLGIPRVPQNRLACTTSSFFEGWDSNSCLEHFRSETFTSQVIHTIPRLLERRSGLSFYTPIILIYIIYSSRETFFPPLASYSSQPATVRFSSTSSDIPR